MKEGREIKIGVSYLPAGAAIAVSLVLEIRDVLHHPVVDLAESQPFLRTTEDGLGYQVGV